MTIQISSTNKYLAYYIECAEKKSIWPQHTLLGLVGENCDDYDKNSCFQPLVAGKKSCKLKPDTT